MPANELIPLFEERYAEISSYLLFLQNVEEAAREGAPRFQGTNAAINPDQKKILNSSLYLQLYNLVEATVLRCLDAIVIAIEKAERTPNDLSTNLRQEWVRAIAQTHADLSAQARLEAALSLCNQLLQQMPIRDFKIDRGGGGNWDDESIFKIFKRVGCTLKLTEKVAMAAKKPLRDQLGALKLVKDRRNSLAHGELSFVDCSDGVTVAELREVADAVSSYLREAVNCFANFIEVEIMQIAQPDLLREDACAP